MKKLALFLGLVLFAGVLVSCTTDVNNPYAGIEYKITYISGNKEITTNVPTYIAGEVTKLPTLEDKETSQFLGWYLNSSYVGNVVTEITASEYGDKLFYAKWGATGSTDVSSLTAALNNIDNYRYTFNYSDTGDYAYEYTYEYMNNSIKSTYDYQGTTYTDYLIYDEDADLFTFYYNTEGEEYSYITEESDYFYWYIYDIDFVYLDSIDASNYTNSGNVFTANEDAVETEAYNILYNTYDGETFTSVTIEVNNNCITKIIITSDVSNDTYGEYTVTYTITFDSYNEIEFSAPENATPIEDSSENYLTIAEVQEASDNTEVSTIGYVVGIVGNNFYISDGEAGVYVYVGNTSVYDVEVGNLVYIAGTKTTYNNLVEIKNLTEVSFYDGEDEILEPIELDDLTQLENYQSMNISFTGLKFVSLPTLDVSSSKDVSVTVTDGVNTATFFISKYLSTEAKTAWYEILSTLTTSDTFNVTNAVVSVYKTYQIALVESSEITKGYQEGDEIVLTKITANKTTLSVANGTTLEEAMESIVIYSYYNNGNQETLNPDEYTYTCDNYEEYVAGTYSVVVTYGTKKVTINITVKGEATNTKPQEGTVLTLDQVADSYGITHGMPSTGNSKALVIPVAFTDYPASPTMVNDLEKTFFGTSEETGWESLQSYYLKSSYGKLNITGTVLEPYNTGKSSSYYTKLYEQGVDADYEIIKSALEYYDATINYSDYDSDGDGYIDALYIIYTAPVDYQSDLLFWWAYTYEYYTTDVELYDGVEADFYFFAGYDFINETLANGETIAYNAETFIHETGHILGLTDYYHGSGNGPDGGAGGGVMQDYNVGDQDAFSKIILGWITPYVVYEKDGTFTLSSFGDSGDAVIVCKNWNGSYFEEYYVIDYYTPDGLNALEAGYSGLMTIDGIRVFHIDATLDEKVVADDGIWEIYQMDNSTTTHKLISLVQADGSNTIEQGKNSSNTDLFQAGTSFTNVKWYDKTSANFTMTVDSIANGKATITIKYN